MKDLKEVRFLYAWFVAGFLIFTSSLLVYGQSIDDFNYGKDKSTPGNHIIKSDIQFNGYTKYWHNTYDEWYSYGNLFKMASPQVEKTILQSKVDMAEEMGIPGLLMQEGFMNALLSGS